MGAEEWTRPEERVKVKRNIEEVDIFDQDRYNVGSSRREKEPEHLQDSDQEKVHERGTVRRAYKVCCGLLHLLSFQKKI